MVRWIASLGLVTFAVVACGGSSDSSVSTPTVDATCPAFAQSLCGDVSTCSAFNVRLAFGTTEACVARYTTLCKGVAALPASGATPDKIQACADASKNLACTEYFASGTSKACPPIAGTLAAGAACSDDTQCASAFCGRKDENTLCGTCVAPPGAGAACVGGKCAAGLQCNSAGTCQVPGTTGQKCSADGDCQDDLRCNMGQCGPGAKAGEACALDQKANHCDGLAGLWCNPLQKKCEPATTAAAGAACGVTATGGLAFCDASSYCKIVDAKKFTGTCTARPADGASCTNDSLYGGPCQAGARCDGGTCRVPDGSCK